MGWFRTETEETNIIDIKTRKAIKTPGSVSKIEEEGEMVTIALDEKLMPQVTFTDQQIGKEEEDVSTDDISDISE
tara:strand:- start:37017 stop:37241 length:225 start_codon:yes stop_codon:yes gene_type:complete